MRALTIALAVPFLCLPLFAEPVSVPTNLGFEDGTNGWRLNESPDYKIEIVPQSHTGTSTLEIANVSGATSGFSQAKQAVDATRYRGRFVRLRGWVRYEGSGGSAGLWMRVDRAGGAWGFFDNMMDRPILSSEWREYEIVGEIARDAQTIAFGGAIMGGGTMWMDDASIAEIDAELAERPRPSRAAAQYLEKVIRIMEKNSINRARVDWTELRRGATLLARGGRKPADTYPAIRYAIRQLADNHSSFAPPAAATEWRGEGSAQPRPEVKIIDGGFGYIGVPSYRGADVPAASSYADEVQQSIATADKEARCGWIIDLRTNNGGNMWPMLTALGPLIGEGPLLSIVHRDHRMDVAYAGGRAFDTHMPKETFPTAAHPYKPQRLPAIAVLTSRRTASSGEAIAIALRARAHARSFGEPTGGFSTANTDYHLNDGAILFLTTGIMADHTGQVYGSSIPPHVEVKGDDLSLSAATQWLRAESGCASE